MNSDSISIDQKASFARFVYAFLFPPESFTDRIDRIKGAEWQKDGSRATLWEPSKFPAEDFLAHVARYLNTGTDKSEGTEPTAQLWKLSEAALRSPAGLGANADWKLVVGKKEISFKFSSFQLMLFRVGVGFLTVRAQPISDRPEDWLDFLHHFRFAWGQRGELVRAERRVAFDPKTKQAQAIPFFPELAGGVALDPDKQVFGRLLMALIETGSIAGESGPWWREAFVPEQLLPFTAIFVDGLAKDAVPPFIYRIQNFFHADQEIHPASSDLALIGHPALLPYADQQWFAFSLDGGAFVACDAPDTKETTFFRETLVDHLGSQYFLLFLLSLHQRFALMSLSEAVAEHWLLPLGKRKKQTRDEAIEDIRDRMLAFTARGHFTQVMQREHHHRCYRKWQETFQIEQLYREVSDEVRDIHEYLLTQRTKQVERRGMFLNLAMFLLGPPTIVFGYLEATGSATKLQAGLAGFVAFVAGGLFFILLDNWLVKRRTNVRKKLR